MAEGPDHNTDAPEGSSPEIDRLATIVRDRGAPLIEALDRHVPGGREHAEATGSYAFAAAVELGCDRGRAELIREGAKLGEVGKVYLPAELVARPAPQLDSDQRSQLSGHHEAGFRLTRGAGVPEGVCAWILRSRERYDGEGPEQLVADRIPIESRIARAACECDRAISAAAADPSGGQAELRRRAIAELRAAAGHELDPDVVDALATVLELAVPD